MTGERRGEDLEELLARRDDLDVGPDEAVRWIVTEDGDLDVEVVPTRYGAFSELEPVDIGEETNAAEDHDQVLYGN